MSEEPKPEEKKIIVDEDWKTQVEREKQAAEQEEPPQPPGGHPLPPPDLTFLASSLYLQTMVALGLLPNPMSDKPKRQLDQAKHTIDVLQMLEDKTQGNRTPDESAALENMLHELRLAYLSINKEG
jgi:hypothetical protein